MNNTEEIDFNLAVARAHITELQHQNNALLIENESLRTRTARRENQLVRFYTRKLALTRWIMRAARVKLVNS